MFNFFKNQKKNKNNFSIFQMNNGFFVNSDTQKSKILAPQESLLLYSITAPVFHSIHIIANEIQNIKPLLYNIEKKEFIQNNKIKNFITHINKDLSLSEFLQKITVYLKVCGSVYIIQTLGSFEPLELFVVNPSNITINVDSSGIIQTFALNKTIFFRDEDSVEGQIRYITEDRKKEIWHIKQPDPQNENIGFSSLNPIYKEIIQYILINEHNNSILRNGCKAGGFISTEERLTPEQEIEIKKMFYENYGGSYNSGKTLFFAGSKMNYTSFAGNLQDMDFLNSLNAQTVKIYNNFLIPQPLVNTTDMAQATYQPAKLSLYENAIFPELYKILDELTRLILPRFGIDINEYKFWYNPMQIEALQQKKQEEYKTKYLSGAYTINEFRKWNGDEPIAGGDILYQPANLLPIDELSGGITTEPNMSKINQVAENFLGILSEKTKK